MFAGSGSLGLEAISRGANFCYFYENSINVIDYLENNCQKICKDNNFEIKNENILLSKFQNVDKKISLVFIDPPYEIDPFEKVLKNINQSAILCNNAIINAVFCLFPLDNSFIGISVSKSNLLDNSNA